MTALRQIPRAVRWTSPVGLIGLAIAVPFSAPDGTGMQWDDLVLAGVAASSAWTTFGLARRMEPVAGRPWRVVAAGIVLFMVSLLMVGAIPGSQFDGLHVDDVFVLAGTSAPLVACAMLARRVSRTRWAALVVDGLVIATALLVVTEVLRAPLVDPVHAPEELRSLVLAYGGYAAIMLGGAGALCTVATAALRRPVSVMMGAVASQAVAAVAEAMAIVDGSVLWTATSAVAVVVGLQTVVVAAGLAPGRFADHTAKAAAPVVSRLGMVLVVGALLSLPVAIASTEWSDHMHSVVAEAGIAGVLTLMALRVLLRMREDGRMTEDLVRSEEDFRGLIEASSDGIAIMDARFRLLFTSPAARSLLGLHADGEDEVSLLDLVDPADRESVRTATVDVAAAEGPPLHFRVLREGGAARDLEATSTERPGSGRRVLYLRDVTNRRRRERELERMAYTDHLTGLPNRALLFRRLARPTEQQRCLLVVDLDGFKALNDQAGHEAGDQLLVEVARRLNTVVREDDLVARLGGDEFAVLVAGALEEAEEVAARVVLTLGVPHRTADGTFAVGASVGVAEICAAGGQAALRAADAALRDAKSAGKGCVRVSGETTTAGVENQPHFHDVVAEGDFSVRLDAACSPDGRIELVHAVPTWTHPLHGTVGGLELWGFAERQGRSTELQNWLLHEACRVVAELPGVGVAVSLPAGFVTAEGLTGEVAGALAASGLPAERLTLSFTEETLMTASAALVSELEAARTAGVRLCLDNYGMGHSLFALLARVPLDMVRVDVGALAGRDDTARALQVFAAILRTTSDFGLTAVAGGISSPEMHAAVVGSGVALLQGRNHPHDLTAVELTALVAVPALPG